MTNIIKHDNTRYKINPEGFLLKPSQWNKQ